MADRLMVLNHPLCFLISRYNKCADANLLKTIIDFYTAEEITVAKELLVDAVSTLQIDSLRKLTRRHDVPLRVVREVEDIFSIMSALDEAKATDKLPKFVSEGPEKMPSIHLVEGDLRVMMDRMNHFESILRDMQATVYAVHADVSKAAIAHIPVVGSGGKGLPLSTGAVGRNNNNPSMNERSVIGRGMSTSMQNSSGAHQLDTERLHAGNWSDFSGSISCDDEVSGAEWETQSTRKRRRILSRQMNNAVSDERALIFKGLAEYTASTIAAASSGVTSAIGKETVNAAAAAGSSTMKSHGGQNYAAAVAKPAIGNTQHRTQQRQHQQRQQVRQVQQPQRRLKKFEPLLVGTKHSSQSETRPGYISAARPYISKAVYCLDNISTNTTADEIANFVSKMGVTVLSCSRVNPRRNHWQRQHDIIPQNIYTFRICIPREESDKFMCADRWPAHIAVSKWIFSKKERHVPHQQHLLESETERKSERRLNSSEPPQAAPSGGTTTAAAAAARDPTSTNTTSDTEQQLRTNSAPDDATVVDMDQTVIQHGQD